MQHVSLWFNFCGSFLIFFLKPQSAYSGCCLIKLLAYILFEKYILIFSIGNGQPREPALCLLYRRTLSFHFAALYVVIVLCHSTNFSKHERRSENDFGGYARWQHAYIGARRQYINVVTTAHEFCTRKQTVVGRGLKSHRPLHVTC